MTVVGTMDPVNIQPRGNDNDYVRAADRAHHKTLALVSAGVVSSLLFVITAVFAASHNPSVVDRRLHLWFLDHRLGWLTDVAIVTTLSGSGPVPYCAAALSGAVVVPLALRSGRWWCRLAGACAGAVTLAAVQLVRAVVATGIGRARPPRADWAFGTHGYAFPSGHTTTSSAAAVLLIAAICAAPLAPELRRLLISVCVVWAGAVGMSRIYLGMHWPSDVVGGWLLTATWTLAGVVAVRCARRRITPPSSAGSRSD